ncbi:MAG: MBL fold metallo-hydrolase [Candidatus Xenobia bacterium]
METVAPGIERLCLGPWPGVNVYFLHEGDGLTLVDTGFFFNGPALLRQLQRMPPLRRILLTHFHPDHSGSCALIARQMHVPVLVHRADLPFVAGQRWLDQEPGWWLTRTLLRLLRLFRIGRTAPPPELIPLEEGDRVGPWQVLHTSGHTPGSASFYDQERCILLCGDNLVHMPWGFRVGVPWWTLDHALQKRSIARYAELGAKLVLSGHGRPWRGDLSAFLRAGKASGSANLGAPTL